MIINMITISENYLIAINIGVVALYLFFILRGAKKGFLLQILSTFGTFLAFFAAWRYCGFASKYYHLWPENLNPMSATPVLKEAVYEYLNEIAWFFALFVIILLLCKILEKMVRGISDLPVIKEISGLLGGILGAMAATVWIVVISMVMRTPMFVNGTEAVENSMVGIISSTSARVVEQFAGPVTSSETFSKLLHNVQDLDGKDKEYIENWLSDHGFDPLAEQGKPAAEPSEETSE